MNMKQIAIYAVATLLLLSGSALAQEMVITESGLERPVSFQFG